MHGMEWLLFKNILMAAFYKSTLLFKSFIWNGICKKLVTLACVFSSKPKMKNRHLNSSTKKSGSKIKPKKRKRESDYSSDDSDIVNSDFDDES